MEGGDLRNGVRGDLVTGGVEALHLSVIGPLVRHVEGGLQRAAVRVLAARVEQVAVELLVEVVDRVVERQQHDLRCVARFQATYRLRAPIFFVCVGGCGSGRAQRNTERGREKERGGGVVVGGRETDRKRERYDRRVENCEDREGQAKDSLVSVSRLLLFFLVMRFAFQGPPQSGLESAVDTQTHGRNRMETPRDFFF